MCLTYFAVVWFSRFGSLSETVFCFIGPFYITVKDGDVTEALLMWNDTPLNATKFKTIEEAFYSMKDMLEDGVSVASGWRFDDVQGVPDEVLVFPAEKEYGTRITVRMPKEFHLQRLEASKKAFAALGLISYSFTFQGYDNLHVAMKHSLF